MKEIEISQEIDALLRFYTGRKLISVEDIREFSRVYRVTQIMLEDTLVEQKQYTCAHCQGRGEAPLIHAVNWVRCEDCKGKGTVDQPPVQPSYEDLMGQAQQQLNKTKGKNQ